MDNVAARFARATENGVSNVLRVRLCDLVAVTGALEGIELQHALHPRLISFFYALREMRFRHFSEVLLMPTQVAFRNFRVLPHCVNSKNCTVLLNLLALRACRGLGVGDVSACWYT